MGAGITPIQSMTRLICRAMFMSCPWVGGKKAWHVDGLLVGGCWVGVHCVRWIRTNLHFQKVQQRQKLNGKLEKLHYLAANALKC